MDRWDREWGDLSQDEILFRIAVVIILASLMIAFLSTVIEAVSFYQQKTGQVISLKHRRVTIVELKPPTHPLRMLPLEIEGFTTIARQMMPGAEKYAAEAIYEPQDEDLSPAAPLNTYVKITFHSSKQVALEKIRHALKERYSINSKTLDFDGQSAYAGYQTDYGSYYLGWVWHRYSIEIDTSYTSDIPADKGSLLSDVTLQIAKVVDASVRQATR